MKGVVLVALALFSYTALSAQARIVPSFSSQTQSGETFTFSASSIKKPTLIVFWATWCKSCRNEVFELKEFQKDHGNDVDIIAINLDDNFKVAQKFINGYSINYRNLKDENGAIADKFGISQTPTLLVVDRSGAIVKQSIRFDSVKALLLSLIEKPEKEKL